MGIFQRLFGNRDGYQEAVAADEVNIEGGSIGTIEASRVRLARSLAGSVAAGENVVMTTSAAFSVRSGSDVVLTAGGAPLILVGGDLHMQNGGSLALAAGTARVDSGFVGLLLARRVALGDNTTLLVDTRRALLIVVGLGVLWPIGRYLLRRFAPAPRPPAGSPPRALPARAGRWLLRRLLMLGVPVLGVWLAYRWLRSKLVRLLPGSAR